ncbi:alpha/beta hydrolase [Sinorhizobium sp. NFACC03]|uniref:alpha/beta fold hydrolase n=1 Tax=Sinorhizobium sp. NFACC03 TaxID=1566295 RepID=UPI00088D79BE|nr:alpha/beta hydrolase [Sinorhizobium sp. NFACC03]SDA45699.1 Pimeloyl-ACP methyl ester carboxylesterase [Sinorhizobium sp. NFACC03]
MNQGGFREHWFLAADDLQLYVRSYGLVRPTPAVPIICLPGLTRNSRDFHELAIFLSSPCGGGHTVFSLDYRGRGNSQRDDDKSHYSIAIETTDIITACTHLGIDRAVFIGTSRGGLILHHLIGVAPGLIAGAVVNDIGPVIEIEGLLAIRDYLNKEPGEPTSWSMAPGYLKELHGADFPILGERDWLQMAKAVYRDEDGTPVPDFDVAIAQQLLGLTAETLLPDLWPQYGALSRMPLLVIRGEHSRLLSEGTVSEMCKRHSGTVAFTARGQGHAPLLHLDGPRQAVSAFVTAITTAAPS